MKILDALFNESTSTTDKGTRFERFVQSFLQKDPTWSDQFEQVWMWEDWPERRGHDLGIDLVARRRDGGLTAIQCKFYDPSRSLQKANIDSFLSDSGRGGFTERIIVSTTPHWGRNAEEAIRGQSIPVRRLGLDDFENSRVDWSTIDPSTPQNFELSGAAEPRPYQRTAIQDVIEGFATHDRGRLIMACGTGKTFTSLRLAEQMVGQAGSVLFLVPSIALLSQALREWYNNAADPGITAMAVCSDAKASKTRAKNEDTAEMSVVDLALPATTDPAKLAERMRDARRNGSGMRVVFATYQSIDVVAQAQKQAGLGGFDLVICDEAHRTTGATLAGAEESAFVRVHDADYLQATKRLYMTATPRIYDDASKAKAGRAQAVLASMDDEDTFGPEFHRLGFGDAVSLGMLTDYKVLILTVEGSMTSQAMRESLAEDYELNIDDAARLIGCWNGLAKRGDAEHDFGVDPSPMRRAVAFAKNIKSSKAVAEEFTGIVAAYQDLAEPEGDLLEVQVEHVDGSMNAMVRAEKLDWLKEDAGENVCRVLSNARCLSEGVDVPSLDAVMFLNPRRSVVDVVQSVGRVMRLAPGKKYGYIILPVVIPAGVEPEQALDRNKSFDVVWEVLQALRAHDERFDAMVNQVELNDKRSTKIDVMGVGQPADERGDGDPSSADAAKAVQGRLDLQLTRMDALRDTIYARLVQKVGSRRYWEQWAKDIADIAQRHIERITLLVDDSDSPAGRQFERFLDALRRNLNDSITRQNAIEMLSQHMITKPVFEALFADYSFTSSNPVSQVMDRMLQTLTSVSAQAETESLEKFYESVRARATGIDNAAGKQKIITELYESFFTTAFSKTADAMGVVYTPIEIVDFILRSVDDVLRAEFGSGITDEGVHVLDPFTGTGTFIVRLLQSELIRPEDLARKYASELHANEILLLAYYIAAINIETTFHDLIAQADGKELGEVPYESFGGIVLTDTFQLTEDGDLGDPEVFGTNNSRAEAQKKLDIQVIVGNPPYSVGQTSGNDDNANVKYSTLDARIAETFAARTEATNKNSLYDSYLRAIRWASDRIGDDGVIGFVTNGGWIQGNTAAGVRKTLAEEFSSIYVFNLRGNQRTAGEQSRREGGKVFGSGSRNTVAVFLLVKRAGHSGQGTINYRDIGDYLSREEKLDIVREATVADIPWRTIIPNEYGDWIGQRDPKYLTYPALGGDDSGLSVFGGYSAGLQTNRDAWVYNSSQQALDANLSRFLDTYDAERTRFAEYARALHIDKPSGADTTGVVTTDTTRIKWTSGLRDRLAKNRPLARHDVALMQSLYRPFITQHVDTSDGLIHRPAVARRYFPTAAHNNAGFWLVGSGSAVPFTPIATRLLPDLHVAGAGSGGNYFPRYRWEPVVGPEDGTLDLGSAPSADVVDDYRRIDNITDGILAHMRGLYSPEVTKDQIFYGIYGLLHSPEYREKYATELKQMLPRIPDLAPSAFVHFAQAGKELFELHADYEDAELYPLEIIGGEQPAMFGDESYYRVQKMRFPKGQKAADEPTELIVNEHITLRGLPPEIYRYQLGSRSAMEWIIRQYQVTTDKASGIVNDPNLWGIEHSNPRYIIDLIQKVATVSVRTQEIVAGLPGIGG